MAKLRIPVTLPYFDESEEKAVRQVLRSGWVTQGPRVAEFEERVCRFTGAKYAVATSSATTALFLSLHVLGIKPGDEVLVPSFSFIATTNVVVHAGATPVFVDVDPDTFNINPEKITEKITRETKAIIPVDQVGLPADYDKIFAIAKKHHLHVIKDAACALGSEYKEKKIGSFGELSCFSFHPRKVITTGEGGMIVTNSKKLADRLRLLRHQGMFVSDLKRHRSQKILSEKFPVIGYNCRMSDIQAAIGVEQMKKLPRILSKRAYLAKIYSESFSSSKNIEPPRIPIGLVHNWQSYVIRLKSRKMTKAVLRQKLLDAGIATHSGIMATHLQKPYRMMYPDLKLPETELLVQEVVGLPLFPQMTKKEQDFVINKVLQLTE